MQIRNSQTAPLIFVKNHPNLHKKKQTNELQKKKVTENHFILTRSAIDNIAVHRCSFLNVQLRRQKRRVASWPSAKCPCARSRITLYTPAFLSSTLFTLISTILHPDISLSPPAWINNESPRQNLRYLQDTWQMSWNATGFF